MKRTTIHVERTTVASADAVWRLLGDSSSWPDWTPIDEYTSVSPGGADGTGEVRQFRNGRVTVREEIVERQPGRRLSYALLDGLPIRNYRADVDLADAPDKADGALTLITWHTSFDPKVPGTGWIYRQALRRATGQFIDGLARASVDA
jgi:uncharacterized protein YndB with AHSA1/START domain